MFGDKRGAAGLSILSNSLLIAAKVAVAVSIGSVSVLSEALHSGTDLVAAVIAFVSLRFASRPADESHPFGHGKAENVSGSVEGLLIFVAAGLIIYKSVNKMLAGAELEAVNWGIGVMAASAVINYFVSRHLFRVAKREDSLALEADSWHLRTDVYTSLGVMAGLLVVRVSGWQFLDPVLALGVALLILKAAWDVTHKSFGGLVDVRLPAEEEAIIRRSIEEHYGEMLGFHDLRTRKAGSERHIELHLVVAKGESVGDAHSLADHLEQDIRARLPRSHITIHVEPCENGDTCPGCQSLTCPERRRHW